MSRGLEVGIVAFLLLISLGGCKKKYSCSYKYLYLGEGVAFAGFDTVELSKIILQQYEAGSNFTRLKASDTVDASDAVFQGDTAYLSIKNMTYYKAFLYLNSDSVEYKIKMPVADKSYAITLTRGEMSVSWVQERECSWGQTATRNEPFRISINGQEVRAYAPYPNNYFICLRR